MRGVLGSPQDGFRVAGRGKQLFLQPFQWFSGVRLHALFGYMKNDSIHHDCDSGRRSPAAAKSLAVRRQHRAS